MRLFGGDVVATGVMIQPQTVLTAVVALTALALFADMGAAVPTENPDSDIGASDGAGLPDPVPDFVSSILDAVGGFLQGAIDGLLGPVVSELAGGATAVSVPNGA